MNYFVKALSSGGEGVAIPAPEEGEIAGGEESSGRSRKRVVFVAGTAPGDLVDVSEVRRVRGVDRAVTWRLVQAGPHRVDPGCVHAAACGGCPWMQVAYEAQVAAKQDLLERALRQAHLLDHLDGSSPVVQPATEVLGYRRRARLFWAWQSGRITLGFHAASSMEIVDATEPPCPVLEASLAGVLKPLADLLAGIVQQEASWDRGQVFLLAGVDSRVHVAFQGGREHARALAWTSSDETLFRGFLEDMDQVVGVGLWTGRGGWRWLGQRDILVDETSGLRGNASGFAQANRSMDDLVRAQAVRLAGDGGSLLELYAGSGNLTRSLARAGRRIVAVESDPAAVARLADSAGPWPGRIKTVRLDALRFVHKALARKEHFDLVVVDPPRKGLGKLAHLLPGLKPRCIVMVSCDPMTASRDLKVLADAGYRLSSIQGFDTMPQTSHFELVALAERL